MSSSSSMGLDSETGSSGSYSRSQLRGPTSLSSEGEVSVGSEEGPVAPSGVASELSSRDAAASASGGDGSSAGGRSLLRAEVSVESTPSVLSEADIDRVRRSFEIPASVSLVRPRPSDRAHDVPEGHLALYVDMFMVGFRVPPHPFFYDVLQHYSLAPTQLAPNAWRSVVGFIARLHRLGHRPTVPLFQACCVVKDHPQGGRWYYFSSRRGISIFSDRVTSVHEWKSKFFFARSCAELPWTETSWAGVDKRKVNRMPPLTRDETAALKALRSSDAPTIAELTSERSLVRVGLSLSSAGVHANFRRPFPFFSPFRRPFPSFLFYLCLCSASDCSSYRHAARSGEVDGRGGEEEEGELG